MKKKTTRLYLSRETLVRLQAGQAWTQLPLPKITDQCASLLGNPCNTDPCPVEQGSVDIICLSQKGAC